MQNTSLKHPKARCRIDARRQSAHARAREVHVAAAELERTGRFGLTRTFIQHGTVSVYAHVCAVAQASLAVADALARIGIQVDRSSLLRGALLHDYFLYDWHDPDPAHRLHGFTHPFTARARAEEDYELTACERIIIERHMFPLVPIPPTCREAWIVCLADKACALSETLRGMVAKWQRKRCSRRKGACA
ncbi:HD domain-containing protein [Collinsella sp. AGMB00827]|uniref:HD domain-containing protein n=1 Tax=Collinsella ureilytica TaxID=2869515 RepID=A0ABS7MLN9_9ACTN|nr:HD domain-containing protein [Collinsella urealyticum]MBY4798212.1 HD domain-containing protein [Collinsella urealyticum]